MNRREMIMGTGMALSAAALGASSPPAAAASTGRRENFLLVHGAWHSAAHWNKVEQHLTAMGHRVHALDLPGSGLDARYPQSYLRNDFGALATEVSPAGDIHLADYADAVEAAIRELARHGKVTVVGHSFGGLAITRAAEAVPHLVRRLVYLSAYVPSKAANAVELSSLPEGATSISGAILIGDPTKTGAMRINPRDADPDYVEKGRQALYNDVPADEYLRFAAYFNPDLPLAVAFEDARGTAARWGRVPRTFIRLTEDHTVPLALQDRMIADADALTPRNRFDTRTLKSSHSPFASMPDRLAEVLASL
jgi:pimeloyl-ACP methyl ester carboxylesterase